MGRRRGVHVAALTMIVGCLATASAQPAPEEDARPWLRPYGILHTRVVLADGALESFGQPNAVAPTAAGNPVLSTGPHDARYGFHVGQTRMGLWLNEGGLFGGQLEVDFVDFSKATPTVASVPRLRIARVEWHLTPAHVLALGQDWDLHAPLNPHGINLVGALFQSGNVGFMRQQLKYLYTREGLELGAALGFPFPNNTPREGLGETATPPTAGLRLAMKAGKGRVGISGLATSVAFAVDGSRERRLAVSGALFAELFLSETTQLRVELNAGQNGANLGLLTLAQGHAAASLRETGGFVSARHALSERHALIGLFGVQRVFGSNPLPSYAYPASSAPIAPDGTASLAGTGPGMRHNAAMRLGYEHKPVPYASAIIEGFAYRSSHVLLPIDEGRGTRSLGKSFGVEFGLLFTL